MSRNITDPATGIAASRRATRRQGYGMSPLIDYTGTSPMPRRSSYDPTLFDAWNAGVRRAADADWIRCGVCGREFGQPSALVQHEKAHRPPA